MQHSLMQLHSHVHNYTYISLLLWQEVLAAYGTAHHLLMTYSNNCECNASFSVVISLNLHSTVADKNNVNLTWNLLHWVTLENLKFIILPQYRLFIIVKKFCTFTNPGHQVTQTTAFHTVAPKNICGPSVWTLLHVTLLAPAALLRWYLDFWKFVHRCHMRCTRQQWQCCCAEIRRRYCECELRDNRHGKC
jgi:hypothetical protein